MRRAPCEALLIELDACVGLLILLVVHCCDLHDSVSERKDRVSDVSGLNLVRM